MVLVGSLPGEKKTMNHEPDRLNFRAQSIDRQPMNSRQQSASTILARQQQDEICRATQTFRFKCEQRRVNFRLLPKPVYLRALQP